MSILWFIIKLILVILLGILLLSLMILGIVLLVPIRYEGYFAKYEEMAYEVKIRYLPGIKADFYLEKGIKRHQVNVLGKKVYKVNEVQDSNEQKVEEEKEEPLPEKVQMEELTHKKKNGRVYKKVSVQLPEKVEGTTEEIGAKAKSIDIKELLVDPFTYKAFRRLLIGIWQLIKIIGPKEWDFEVILGKGDPADTGELIAKLTMLYPLYYKHGIVRGDYEKECLMGGCLIKGRFNLMQVIILMVRLYFNEDIHAFVHLIKK